MATLAAAAREIIGVLSTIVVAEFCHRRMMQEAQSRGLAAANPAKALAQNPAFTLFDISRSPRRIQVM